VIVGIDPGQKTGIAVILDCVLGTMTTERPENVAPVLQEWMPRLVIFEDSRRNTVYHRRGQNARTMLHIARSVGEIDQLCREIENTCERLGIKCIGVSPQRKGAKIKAGEFAAITGWQGRSNQHERDAAMVAWPYRRAR